MEFYLLSNDSEIIKLAVTFRRGVDFAGGDLPLRVREGGFPRWGKNLLVSQHDPGSLSSALTGFSSV